MPPCTIAINLFHPGRSDQERCCITGVGAVSLARQHGEVYPAHDGLCAGTADATMAGPDYLEPAHQVLATKASTECTTCAP